MALEIKNQDQGLKELLPRIFNEQTMYSVIHNLMDERLDCSHGKVEFDFKNLEHIGAGGIAVLSNVIELLKKSGVAVACLNAETSKARKQLQDFGFFKKYINVSHEPQRTRWRLPLRIVPQENSFSYIQNTLIPWIAAAFDTDEAKLGNITVVFQEIFNNIVDHSSVHIGCACAQFDKRNGVIRLCISDFGVGIPSHVKAAMPSIELDSVAIAKACEHGFTTQSTPGNMGAGLHIIRRNITQTTSGQLDIYSYGGIYSIRRIDGKVKTRLRSPKNHFYPGTMFFITLDAKDFTPLAEEHFEW